LGLGSGRNETATDAREVKNSRRKWRNPKDEWRM